MFRTIFMLKFRNDITPEQGFKEWLGDHGDLALTLPGLRGYVQNHWIRPAAGHEQVFDGSVELTFDDEAAFEAAFTGPVGQAMLEDDLRIFDRSGSPAYIGSVVERHVML